MNKSNGYASRSAKTEEIQLSAKYIKPHGPFLTTSSVMVCQTHALELKCRKRHYLFFPQTVSSNVTMCHYIYETKTSNIDIYKSNFI